MRKVYTKKAVVSKLGRDLNKILAKLPNENREVFDSHTAENIPVS
jgi:hypothetical protein